MIYQNKFTAKTGEEIPVFKDGKPMNSRYNPSLEAMNFAESVSDGFIVTGGAGCALHILALLKKYPDSFIIAVEADQESLEFCRTFPAFIEAQSKPNVRFITEDKLEKELLENYIPVKYKNFSLSFIRAWEAENKELSVKIHDTVQKTLKRISADFSVQSHFGKIWHHNIIINSARTAPWSYSSPEKKQALICAAGPTLEDDIGYIKENSAQSCIIAADTAFSTLLEYGIIPDVTVSTDPQKISAEHFFNCPVQSACKKTILFVLDISTNPVIAETVVKRGHKAVFYKNGHPLAQTLFPDSLPLISAAGGTVTAACADFALKAGFTSITFTGADFAYVNGKPYARGTYLERGYNSSSRKLSTAETKYCGLMYRTELKHTENPGFLTTEVMETYRNSLEEWLSKNGFTKHGRTYRLHNNTGSISCTGKRHSPAECTDKTSYLPLCAWLKKYNGEKTEEEILKLALAYSLRYNRIYES
ncbi:MAG: motility associated factor glycosyltransferase family protein [Treponema sp.]|nr:motility associated factor glycosyltransferase family protein [Treponema sp.]